MSEHYFWVMLFGIASQLLQNWKDARANKRGFSSLEGKIANTYVPVTVYSAKVKELHDEINALRTELAILKDRTR